MIIDGLSCQLDTAGEREPQLDQEAWHVCGTFLVPVTDDGKEAKRMRLGEHSREGLRKRKSQGEKEVILLEA